MLQTTMMFLSYTANLAAQGGDSYLTGLGLSKGFSEGNPVTRFLIKKLGEAGANAIKMGALPLLPTFGFAIAGHPGYAIAFNFLLTGLTLPVVIRDFIMLKRKGIAILSN